MTSPSLAAALACLLLGASGVSAETGHDMRQLDFPPVEVVAATAIAVAEVGRVTEVTARDDQTRLPNVFRNVVSLREISVEGNRRVGREEIERLLGVTRGEWLWKAVLRDHLRDLRRNSWIESVDTSWSFFPPTLRLRVHEAAPWLVAEFAGRSWLISTRGEPLQPLDRLRGGEAILEASELPRLDGITESGGSVKVATGRFRDSVRMLRLLEAAGGLPFPVERYTFLVEGGVRVTPQAGTSYPTVLILPDTLSGVENTLEKLRVVLKDLERRGESRREIDTRFLGQAVVR